MAMSEDFQEALAERGVALQEVTDTHTGHRWLLGVFPNGTQVALPPGSRFVEWHRGDGPWRVEIGDREALLKALQRGPPEDLDKLPSGLPPDWTGRLDR